jgi:hypothetical protein
MTLCMRGSLVFECDGQAYRLLPGTVFVTQPDEPHRLSTNPKGLVMLGCSSDSMLRRVPLWDFPPRNPTSSAVRSAPCHGVCFKGTDRLRHAFQRLFRLYDEHDPTPSAASSCAAPF